MPDGYKCCGENTGPVKSRPGQSEGGIYVIFGVEVGWVRWQLSRPPSADRAWAAASRSCLSHQRSAASSGKHQGPQFPSYEEGSDLAEGTDLAPGRFDHAHSWPNTWNMNMCGWKRGSMESHPTGWSDHTFLNGQVRVGSQAPGT